MNSSSVVYGGKPYASSVFASSVSRASSGVIGSVEWRSPRTMTNRPENFADRTVGTPGTSRPTGYFGGGTSSCTTVFTVATGRPERASRNAKRRPSPRVQPALQTGSVARSIGPRSGVCTACTVCWLIVIGFGKHRTVPSGWRIAEVVGHERELGTRVEQLQHRRRLAGVGERRDHVGAVVLDEDGTMRRARSRA